MHNGILLVYKEAGYTSHDVVRKLKGILQQKKIGHTGTLDPDAVGVLPVCLGKGTKLAEFLNEKDKEYVAVLRLGKTTDTQDAGGKVLSERPVQVREEEVLKTLLSFRGNYAQIPPMYSALKVNGKKLYDLARAGIEIERKPRVVEIKELEILHVSLPEVKFRVACSKGTYIRTLCHDTGEKLGCGGVMAALERTRAGEFIAAEAYTLAQIEELVQSNKITDVIKSVDMIFSQYQAVTVTDEFRRLVKNGNRLEMKHIIDGADLTPGEVVRVYGQDGVFYALYEFREAEMFLKPVKMFL